MPDADGRIRPVSIPHVPWHDEEPELDVDEPEFEIEWTPDPSLDGAFFVPEGP